MRGILFNTHATAAAKALLAAPKLTVDESLIDGDPGWQPLYERNQALAVRLSCC
jgi:hypothetical protein